MIGEVEEADLLAGRADLLRDRKALLRRAVEERPEIDDRNVRDGDALCDVVGLGQSGGVHVVRSFYRGGERALACRASAPIAAFTAVTCVSSAMLGRSRLALAALSGAPPCRRISHVTCCGQVGEVEEAAGAPAAGRLQRGEVGEERQVAEMRPGVERDPGRHVRRHDGVGDRRRVPGRGERVGRIVGEADAAARPGALVVGDGEMRGVDRHRLDLHHRRAEGETERQHEGRAVLADQTGEKLRQPRKTHRRRLRHHGDAVHHHAVDERQHGLGRIGGEAGKGLRAGDQPDRRGSCGRPGTKPRGSGAVWQIDFGSHPVTKAGSGRDVRKTCATRDRPTEAGLPRTRRSRCRSSGQVMTRLSANNRIVENRYSVVAMSRRGRDRPSQAGRGAWRPSWRWC